MNQPNWQVENLAAIKARLDELQAKPDGIIYFEPAGVHFIVVIKKEGQIRQALVEQTKPRTNLAQSWLALDDPLYLPAYYTQAAMLGLIWPARLHRACIVGFGGGRIPMLLHHYYPEAMIEAVDIDPHMVEVARRFFGIQLDERLTVTIQDGREYLAQRSRQYDLIFVDVFLGNGYTPYRLATAEFYRLCQAHLSTDGVLMVNILDSDAFYSAKIKTIQSVFEQVYLAAAAGNSVIFAAQGELRDSAELLDRAAALQATHQFSFPLDDRAAELKMGSALDEQVPDLEQAPILVDDAPPPGYFEDLPSFDTAFSTVQPEHPCPCGSGLAFEQCHGQVTESDR